MRYNYTTSILTKTIERLNAQISIQSEKEPEMLSDELFLQEDIENMQRQVRELQSAILQLNGKP